MSKRSEGAKKLPASPEPKTHLKLGKASISGFFSKLLGQKLPFDVGTDFTPIGLMAHQPTMVVGRNDLPANSLKELIDG